LKSASISEIKLELENAPAKDLSALLLRVIKYKKDNKELLNFLLFESHDLQGYIKKIKTEIDDLFLQINQANIYFAKKSLRKILKITNKHIKYIAIKEAEAELLIYYCTKIKKSGIKMEKSAALTNLYYNQIKKIKLIIETLHQDLQHDYAKEIKQLSE